MYASHDDKKQSNLEEYAKELSEKVANIPPKQNHMMTTEDFDNFDFESILKDLECFLKSDLMDFENYERWLEDDVEPN